MAKKPTVRELEKRVDALTHTLGTLIAWLPRELGEVAQKELLDMLSPAALARRKNDKGSRRT